MGQLLPLLLEDAISLPIDVAIPKGSILEKVETNYGPLKDPVRCGLCGTPHQKGYIVWFRPWDEAPHERALMGHVCGKREFGATWAQEVHNLEIRQRLAEIQLEFQTFLVTAPPIEERLRRLLPGLEARSEVRQYLTGYTSDFMRRVSMIFKSEGGSNGQGKRLQGDLFFQQDNAAQKTRLILCGIKLVREMANDPKTSMKSLKEKLTKLQSEIQRIDDIDREAASGRVALNPANFAQVIAAVGMDIVRLEGTRLSVFGEIWRGQRLEKAWIVVGDLADPILAS